MPPLAVLFHAPERDPSYTPTGLSDNTSNSPAINGDQPSSATSSSSSSSSSVAASASPARPLLAAFQAVSHGGSSSSLPPAATFQSSAYRALNGVSTSSQQSPGHQSSWTVYRDPPEASGSSSRSQSSTLASSDEVMPEDIEADNEQENVAPPVPRSQASSSSASRRRRRTSTLANADTIPSTTHVTPPSSSIRQSRDAFTTPSPPQAHSHGRTVSAASRVAQYSQERSRDVTPPSQILPASTPVRNAERVAREHLGLNDSDDEGPVAEASSEARRKRARLSGIPSS